MNGKQLGVPGWEGYTFSRAVEVRVGGGWVKGCVVEVGDTYARVQLDGTSFICPFTKPEDIRNAK